MERGGHLPDLLGLERGCRIELYNTDDRDWEGLVEDGGGAQRWSRRLRLRRSTGASG
jgi:hypothetical protein